MQIQTRFNIKDKTVFSQRHSSSNYESSKSPFCDGLQTFSIDYFDKINLIYARIVLNQNHTS